MLIKIRNYCNRIFLLLFTPILLLTGCSKGTEYAVLQFPDTKWGMSMTEAMKAYKVTEKETSYYNKDNSFFIKDRKLFGVKTENIEFYFINFTKGAPKLCAVRVTYPDTADMKQVQKNMRKAYGSTVSAISIYGLFQIFDDSLPVRKYSETEHLKLWSGKTVTELIPWDENTEYRDLWKKYQPGLEDDNWISFIEDASQETVVWSDNGEFPDSKKKNLYFYGYNFAVYQEIKNQISGQK